MKEAVGERAGDSWVLLGEDPVPAPEDPTPAPEDPAPAPEDPPPVHQQPRRQLFSHQQDLRASPRHAFSSHHQIVIWICF